MYNMNFIDPRSRVSVEQMLTLFDYMKKNPQVTHSRFSRTKEGNFLLKQHWAACADLANNVTPNCAQKTPDQWRNYYNAYKSKIKKKVKNMKAEMASTGGPVKNRLSELENRLYVILGPDLGERLPRVCNTPVSFQHHELSGSTAEVLLQNDTISSIGRSDSSELELYYPEDENGHLAANSEGNMGQLASETVAHTDQQLEHLVHNGRQQEPAVHNIQDLEPEVYAARKPERVGHINQRLDSMVNTNQRSERVVRSDQIKSGNVEGSPRRRRTASSEQNCDPVIREANDDLLNVERMKVEANRYVAAALHRLAGAMEAIAERLQDTSPPRVKRYARISSSESD